MSVSSFLFRHLLPTGTGLSPTCLYCRHVVRPRRWSPEVRGNRVSSVIYICFWDRHLSLRTCVWIFTIRLDRRSSSQATESESVAAFRDSAEQMANDYFYSLFLHYMQKYLLTLYFCCMCATSRKARQAAVAGVGEGPMSGSTLVLLLVGKQAKASAYGRGAPDICPSL